MRKLRRLIVPLAFTIAALAPTAASAQQMQPNPGAAGICGPSEAVPMPTEGTLDVAQPDTLGRHDEGVLNYSAVRGSIVHMEGDLVLLRLESAGMGNAAPNHPLAGDTWAVVRMPDGCPASSFGMGTPILAVGTPDGHGVLEALEVAPAG